jgi:hypothetical protein
MHRTYIYFGLWSLPLSMTYSRKGQMSQGYQCLLLVRSLQFSINDTRSFSPMMFTLLHLHWIHVSFWFHLSSHIDGPSVGLGYPLSDFLKKLTLNAATIVIPPLHQRMGPRFLGTAPLLYTNAYSHVKKFLKELLHKKSPNAPRQPYWTTFQRALSKWSCGWFKASAWSILA